MTKHMNIALKAIGKQEKPCTYEEYKLKPKVRKALEELDNGDYKEMTPNEFIQTMEKTND